jgi:uncharacterized protein (TIGR03083 family)
VNRASQGPAAGRGTGKPMERSDVWTAIDDQRRALVRLLGDLSEEEWRQPSLCDGWTIRQVAAHLALQNTPAGQRHCDSYRARESRACVSSSRPRPQPDSSGRPPTTATARGSAGYPLDDHDSQSAAARHRSMPHSRRWYQSRITSTAQRGDGLGPAAREGRPVAAGALDMRPAYPSSSPASTGWAHGPPAAG